MSGSESKSNRVITIPRVDEAAFNFIFDMELKFSNFMTRRIKQRFAFNQMLDSKKPKKRYIKAYQHKDYPGNFKLGIPKLPQSNFYSYSMIFFSSMEGFIVHTLLKEQLKKYGKRNFIYHAAICIMLSTFFNFMNFNIIRYLIWKIDMYVFTKRLYLESKYHPRLREFQYILRQKK